MNTILDQGWISFFKVLTDCSVESMLRRTRWISDRTSGNCFERNQDIKSLSVSENNFGATSLYKKS